MVYRIGCLCCSIYCSCGERLYSPTAAAGRPAGQHGGLRGRNTTRKEMLQSQKTAHNHTTTRTEHLLPPLFSILTSRRLHLALGAA